MEKSTNNNEKTIPSSIKEMVEPVIVKIFKAMDEGRIDNEEAKSLLMEYFNELTMKVTAMPPPIILFESQIR